MREFLNLSGTLFRFGVRSAFGTVFSMKLSRGLMPLIILANIYYPIWMLRNIRSSFLDFTAAQSIESFLQDWKLWPCVATSCQELLGASRVWPELPQLFWLGTAPLFFIILLLAALPFATHRADMPFDRDLEWMRNFPIRWRAYLWGRLLESSLLNYYALYFLGPFFLGFALAHGRNLLWTVPMALFLAWLASLTTISIRMNLDNLIQTRLPLKTQRIFRVWCSAFVFGASFLCLFVVSGSVTSYWSFIFEYGHRFQDAWLLRLLELFLSADFPGFVPLMILLALALGIAALQIHLVERRLQQGAAPSNVEKEPSTYEARPRLLDRLPIMVRRELLFLRRDQSMLAILLMVPLALVILFYQDVGTEDGMAYDSVLALCLIMAVIVLSFGSIIVFAREKAVYWFYATTPRSFRDIAKEQLLLFRGLAVLIALAVPLLILPQDAWQDSAFVLRFALALFCLGLYDIHHRDMRVHSMQSSSQPEFSVGQTLILMPGSPIMAMLLAYGPIWLIMTATLIYMIIVVLHRKVNS